MHVDVDVKVWVCVCAADLQRMERRQVDREEAYCIMANRLPCQLGSKLTMAACLRASLKRYNSMHRAGLPSRPALPAHHNTHAFARMHSPCVHVATRFVHVGKLLTHRMLTLVHWLLSMARTLTNVKWHYNPLMDVKADLLLTKQRELKRCNFVTTLLVRVESKWHGSTHAGQLTSCRDWCSVPMLCWPKWQSGRTGASSVRLYSSRLNDGMSAGPTALSPADMPSLSLPRVQSDTAGSRSTALQLRPGKQLEMMMHFDAQAEAAIAAEHRTQAWLLLQRPLASFPVLLPE